MTMLSSLASRSRSTEEVAVKIPIFLDQSTGKHFLQEVTSWQQLSHPNILQLYDVNILPIPHLEMQLCETSLHEISKPLSVREAAGLILQIAQGLKHTHSKNILHQDLKPQNILLKNGIPKISDWNVSKVASETQPAVHQGFSLPYAAPEHISPEKFGKPDHRTDIYQLGTVFYELLTGEPPFKADNTVELFAQILGVEPKRPFIADPDDVQVIDIIMKCLHKKKEDRYQSVEEMERDLAEYLSTKYNL